MRVDPYDVIHAHFENSFARSAARSPFTECLLACSFSDGFTLIRRQSPAHCGDLLSVRSEFRNETGSRGRSVPAMMVFA